MNLDGLSTGPIPMPDEGNNPGPPLPNPVSVLVWCTLHVLSLLVPYTCPNVFWSLFSRPGFFSACGLLLHFVGLTWVYLRVSTSDPGFLTPAQSARLSRLREQGHEELFSICPQCGTRPLRARHCRECGRCVCSADHHCGFLGVCVGEGNHLAFARYLLVEIGYLIHVVASTGKAVFPRPMNTSWTDFVADNIQYFISCLIISGFLLFVIYLCIAHAILLVINRSTREYIKDIQLQYLLVPPAVILEWEAGTRVFPLMGGENSVELRWEASGSRGPDALVPEGIPARQRTWADLRAMERAWNGNRHVFSLSNSVAGRAEFLPACWAADTSDAEFSTCFSQYKVCNNEVYSCCD